MKNDLFLDQLINENWIKEIYQTYYSDQPLKLEMIEDKVNHCLKKYQNKIENLKSRHTYYITETSTPLPLTSISYKN
jgi:hypothetical protein